MIMDERTGVTAIHYQRAGAAVHTQRDISKAAEAQNAQKYLTVRVPVCIFCFRPMVRLLGRFHEPLYTST